MSSTATYCVEDEDGAELNEAVKSHVSKETEGGDQRTSALSEQRRRKNASIFLCCRYCTTNIAGSFGFQRCPPAINLLF